MRAEARPHADECQRTGDSAGQKKMRYANSLRISTRPLFIWTVKIGMLQLDPTIGAFDTNRQKLLAAYHQGVQQGAEFVIAPELFLCGYPPRDLLLRADFIEANLTALAHTAKEIGPVPLCLGFVDR